MRSDWFVSAAAILGVAFCFYLASPFLPAILGARVLAVVFEPLTRRLNGAIRHRGWAAAIGVVLAILLVVIPLALVATDATRELRAVFAQISARSDAEGGWFALLDGCAAPGLEWVAAHTGVPAGELRAAVVDRVAQAGGAVLRSTTAVAAGLTEVIVQVVVAIMTLFFLLRDGDSILEHLRSHSPLDDKHTGEMLASTAASVVANVYGVLGVAASQGFLAGAGFWMVDLPSPVLWGLVTALFSLVPLVGSGIVWAPAAIMLAAGGAWGRALLLLAWGGGVVAMSDNFVRPWIVGQRTNSNPLLVFFALLGGAKLFGLAGLFIGPAVLSLTAVLLKFWRADRSAAID